MEELSPEQRNLVASYSIMMDDLKEIFEFIDPTNINRRVYSHKIYALFLRAATEFESICKLYLTRRRYKRQGKEVSSDAWNISDYKTIGEHYQLNRYEVGLLFWQPKTKYVSPFADWETTHTLSWYKAYNEVKHNRQAKFPKANLENLLMALSAVFAMICHIHNLYVFNDGKPLREAYSGGFKYYYIENSLLSLRVRR